MSTLSASLKKFERWSARLNDASSDVRQEALKILGQIADAEVTLAARSLNLLALHISENRFDDLYYALNAVSNISTQVILTSPALLNALIKAPLAEDYEASSAADILLSIVVSDELRKDSSQLQDIIQRSQTGLLLGHKGGRRDFLKIVDWAQDNDVRVPASLPSKATETKARSKRPSALNNSDSAGPALAVGDQHPTSLPQNVSVAHAFVLDHNQIRQKQEESETVSEYLSHFFNPDESETTRALVAATSPVGARVGLSGLEPILFAFALRLASRATWKRAHAEALAASLGLMLDGALEHLNEAALSEWSVLFAEGTDPIELSAEVIAGLTTQVQTAAP